MNSLCATGAKVSDKKQATCDKGGNFVPYLSLVTSQGAVKTKSALRALSPPAKALVTRKWYSTLLVRAVSGTLWLVTRALSRAVDPYSTLGPYSSLESDGRFVCHVIV